jgi:hypothetical protein
MHSIRTRDHFAPIEGYDGKARIRAIEVQSRALAGPRFSQESICVPPRKELCSKFNSPVRVPAEFESESRHIRRSYQDPGCSHAGSSRLQRIRGRNGNLPPKCWPTLADLMDILPIYCTFTASSTTKSHDVEQLNVCGFEGDLGADQPIGL